VQLEPIKPTLKAPGTKSLKLNYDEPLSFFAFKLNLRRYNEDRLAMLMSKIDDIINSVVRQCSFDAFEAKVHSARAAGTLTPDEMTTAGGALRLSTRPTLNLLLLLFVFLFLNNVHRAPRRFTW